MREPLSRTAKIWLLSLAVVGGIWVAALLWLVAPRARPHAGAGSAAETATEAADPMPVARDAAPLPSPRFPRPAPVLPPPAAPPRWNAPGPAPVQAVPVQQNVAAVQASVAKVVRKVIASAVADAGVVGK